MIEDWTEFLTPSSSRDGVGEHILRKATDPSRVRKHWEKNPPFPSTSAPREKWEGGPIPGGDGTERAREFVIPPPEPGKLSAGKFESPSPPSRKRGEIIQFVPKGADSTPPTASTKKKRPPSKLEVVVILNDPKEFDLRYGVPKKAPFRNLLQVVKLSNYGVPTVTKIVLDRDPSTYQPVAWWGGGVTGPLTMAFPLPGEWSFAGSSFANYLSLS